MTKEQRTHFTDTLIDQMRLVMILFILIFLILSYLKNVFLVVWAFLPLQILAYTNLFYHRDVLSFEEKREIQYQIYVGLMMFQLVVLNSILINEIA